MKTNERKRLHLYIISTALLVVNGVFLLQMKKKCSDKKRKGKAILFEHIKLEIPKKAQIKQALPHKQQLAPRRTNTAAGSDQANDSIQYKCPVKTNPKAVLFFPIKKYQEINNYYFEI